MKALPRVLQRPRRLQPLDHDLIRRVRRHAADDHREHDRDDVDRLKEERLHAGDESARSEIHRRDRRRLPGRGRDVPDVRESAAAPTPPAIDDDGREAAEADAELRDVVPDDRLDAAKRGVERDDGAEADDEQRQRNAIACGRADREARHVDRRGHPAEPPHDEDHGGQRADADVEARFSRYSYAVK